MNYLAIVYEACIQLLEQNGWKPGLHNCGSYFKGTRQINVNKENNRLMILFNNNKHVYTVTTDNVDNALITYFIEH